MNINELENAIKILLEPSQATPQYKQQALEYTNSFIDQHFNEWRAIFTLLTSETSSFYVKFWCLQSLTTIVNRYFPQAFHDADRVEFINTFMAILKTQPQLVFSARHIEIKYALLFVTLVKKEYPHLWKNAFVDLLALMNIENDALKKKYMGLISRVFTLFEEEIVEYSENKNNDDFKRVTEIKDGLRFTVIKDIVFLLGQVLQNAHAFSDDIQVVQNSLKAIDSLIDWNDLSLFLGMVPIFVEFLKVDEVKTESLECLHALIDKGKSKQFNPRYAGHYIQTGVDPQNKHNRPSRKYRSQWH